MPDSIVPLRHSDTPIRRLPPQLSTLEDECIWAAVEYRFGSAVLGDISIETDRTDAHAMLEAKRTRMLGIRCGDEVTWWSVGRRAMSSWKFVKA